MYHIKKLYTKRLLSLIRTYLYFLSDSRVAYYLFLFLRFLNFIITFPLYFQNDESYLLLNRSKRQM
jgi:hypothetical protein